MTRVIDALEERALVERAPSPLDRRIKLVFLTCAGRRRRDELLEALYEPPASFSSLTPDEQNRLIRLLIKVASHATGTLDETPAGPAPSHERRTPEVFATLPGA
jgi:DNA-binding MarR family transcriptional regulator